jgi:3-oxoacyl-(acyl-carrier-protein) synthase III
LANPPFKIGEFRRLLKNKNNFANLLGLAIVGQLNSLSCKGDLMRQTAGTTSNALPADIRNATEIPQAQSQAILPRRYQRGAFNVPVCIQQGSQQTHGETVDFTPGGLRLLCRTIPALTPGSALNLTFQFGETCNLTTAAQVAYCLEPSADEMCAVGIRFAGLRDWEQTIVLSALKELSESDQSRRASLITLHVSENTVAHEAASLVTGTPPPAIELRRHRRAPVTIPGTLTLDGHAHDFHACDIGADGMGLTADVGLAAKTPVVIQWRFNGNVHHDIAGQVVYSQPHTDIAGARFAIGITFLGRREWETNTLAAAAERLLAHPEDQAGSTLAISVAGNALSLEQKKFYCRSRQPLAGELGTLRTATRHAAKIVGWGAYVPPNELTNDDVNAILKVKGEATGFADIVGRLTGIKARRYAGSAMLPSDLAVEASRQALQRAGIDPKEVDVIISCGVARDVEEPATAYIIQEKLGADRAYCFDLVNACNGFISALDVLDAFIASGRCKTGLVAVGDILSQYVTWDAKSPNDLHMSSMSYTFGDAGGAAVLTHRSDTDTQGLHGSWFLSDGSYWKVAVIPLIDQKARYFKSNASNIERAALEHVPGGVEEVMQFLGWTVEDIKLVIPHQVSSQIIEDLFYKRLRMPPEKVLWSFPRHGNVGAASMPVALCHAIDAGLASPGDKILLVGGSGGFGAGVLGLTL